MKDVIKMLTSGNIPFKTDMPATLVSSYRGGGTTAVIAYPESSAALAECLRAAAENGVPYMPLGNGTNILVKDGGFNGIMISLIGFRNVTRHGNSLVCGAGAGLASIANTAARCNLSGLEELSGIPGTAGGALRMNAGAFGRELSELIDSVTVYDTVAREVRRLTRGEIPFSYRSSGNVFEKAVALETTLLLTEGVSVKEKSDFYRDKRRSKQPCAPSLGSVFLKTADGMSAGYYIEKSGLKGARVGGAEISEKHANFIVNRGGGTAKDYCSLMSLAHTVVESKYGITLEPEIVIVGKE